MIVPPWVYPASAAALLAIGFAGGWQVQGWRCEAAQKKAIERAIKRANDARAKIHEEATKYEQDREAGRQESIGRQERIREVYRTVEVPAVCEPPADAQRVLDDAIRAANARAGGGAGAGLPDTAR